MDTAIKPAVLIWVTVEDSIRMPQGKIPQTWYTHVTDIPEPFKFIQILVPHDYFIQMYYARAELAAATRDLLL